MNRFIKNLGIGLAFWASAMLICAPVTAADWRGASGEATKGMKAKEPSSSPKESSLNLDEIFPKIEDIILHSGGKISLEIRGGEEPEGKESLEIFGVNETPRQVFLIKAVWKKGADEGDAPDQIEGSYAKDAATAITVTLFSDGRVQVNHSAIFFLHSGKCVWVKENVPCVFSAKQMEELGKRAEENLIIICRIIGGDMRPKAKPSSPEKGLEKQSRTLGYTI